MKNLDKKLDTIFSIYIRLKYTNDFGHGHCYSCDDKVTYKNADCGHYIRRGNTQFRWSKDNARIQCQVCNRELDGNLEVYRDRLIQELHSINVAKMEFLSKQPYKWSKHDKNELFKKLKKECQDLLSDKMFIVALP